MRSLTRGKEEMKKINLLFTTIILLGVGYQANASPLNFHFHSPSFSGVGSSGHYLTIENLETTRKQAIIKKAEDEAKALELELEYELANTPIELFRKNLESRFYTALAKNVIENVFGTDGTRQDGGTTVIDGYTITWTSTGTNNDADGTTLTIKDANGNTIYDYIMPFQEQEGWAFGDVEG
jgi:hypothetical protein